jgi:hypothetical protein
MVELLADEGLIDRYNVCVVLLSRMKDVLRVWEDEIQDDLDAAFENGVETGREDGIRECRDKLDEVTP